MLQEKTHLNIVTEQPLLGFFLTQIVHDIHATPNSLLHFNYFITVPQDLLFSTATPL